MMNHNDNNISNSKSCQLYICARSPEEQEYLDSVADTATISIKKEAHDNMPNIYFYIKREAMSGLEHRVTPEIRILSYKNDVIEEIQLNLCYEETKICTYYMTDIPYCNYKSCDKITFKHGVLSNHILITYDFDNKQQEEVEELYHNVNFQNIRHLKFESIFIDMDALLSISNFLPHLQSIDFTDCSFGYYQDDGEEKPIMDDTTISLSDTNIDTLCFRSEKKDLFIDYKLALIFVESVDQGFSKGFICTSKSKESIIKEISKELFLVLFDEMYYDCTSCLKVKAKINQKFIDTG